MTDFAAGDETFERFRRKLADVTLAALNDGGPPISSDGARGHHWMQCRCPLGCLFDAGNRRPGDETAAKAFGIRTEDALDFINAFDGNDAGAGPYAELGAAYAKRFP